MTCGTRRGFWHMLSSSIEVSEPYAVDIRAGRRLPHLRYWQALASLVGFTEPSQ